MPSQTVCHATEPPSSILPIRHKIICTDNATHKLVLSLWILHHPSSTLLAISANNISSNPFNPFIDKPNPNFFLKQGQSFDFPSKVGSFAKRCSLLQSVDIFPGDSYFCGNYSENSSSDSFAYSRCKSKPLFSFPDTICSLKHIERSKLLQTNRIGNLFELFSTRLPRSFVSLSQLH